MQLFPHQQRALKETEQFNKVAYYLDMGLGKTFVGSEKALSFGIDILVVCQKSKIADWIKHFFTYYIDHTKCDESGAWCYDLTKNLDMFTHSRYKVRIGIINYELAFRRVDLLELTDFTLMLDESSMIQNETAKRSKFILKMKPKNVILLSGTPTAGKYEKLWSQLHLLGWDIKKDLYYKQYVNMEYFEDKNSGFRIPHVVGYKNVDRLKYKLAEHGAIFMKSEEVFDLPKQIDVPINHKASREYNRFMKDSIITIDDREYIGDTILSKRIYARMMCGHLNENRLVAFKDLVLSTEDRLIVFYNFTEELKAMQEVMFESERPISIVNGSFKDLKAYEECDNSITFIQYQAGAMGLNLQKANKVIYFSLTDRSELYEQSKKRIHRIGQEQNCFYYLMYCPGTVEEEILNSLRMRKDYTDELFKKYQENFNR